MAGRIRIYGGWWVVGAAIVGMSTGPAQFAFGSLGLFMGPFGDAFGWNRAEISLALTFFTVALLFSLPVAGRLVDRYGSRPVLIPSILVVGVLLGLIPLVLKATWHLWLIFALSYLPGPDRPVLTLPIFVGLVLAMGLRWWPSPERAVAHS